MSVIRDQRSCIARRIFFPAEAHRHVEENHCNPHCFFRCVDVRYPE